LTASTELFGGSRTATSREIGRIAAAAVSTPAYRRRVDACRSCDLAAGPAFGSLTIRLFHRRLDGDDEAFYRLKRLTFRLEKLRWRRGACRRQRYRVGAGPPSNKARGRQALPCGRQLAAMQHAFVCSRRISGRLVSSTGKEIACIDPLRPPVASPRTKRGYFIGHDPEVGSEAEFRFARCRSG